MARPCTVCTHPERATIDTALVRRRSFRDIARQFGVSKDAAVRHHDEHLPDRLAAAKGVEDAAAADDLLGQVRELRGHALDILTAAKDAPVPDHRTALSAIREARGCIELFVKVRQAEELEGRIAALEQQLAASSPRPRR